MTKTKKWMGILALALCICMLFAACGCTPETEEKEEYQEGLITNGVNLNWPAKHMGDFPKPKFGIVNMVHRYRDGQGCELNMGKVNRAQAEGYLAQVKALNYTVDVIESSSAAQITYKGKNAQGQMFRFAYKESNELMSLAFLPLGIDPDAPPTPAPVVTPTPAAN